jgi:putative phage-type endonuclease
MQSLEQNTQEWLDWRKEKVCASDLPIILGISPYCTPYDLWRKKVGFIADEKETGAMKYGKELEPEIRDYVNDSMEYLFWPIVKEHPRFSWAAASLDGCDEQAKVILEIKCTSKGNHEMVRRGSCPDMYYPQIQWQLFVTGYEICILAHYYCGEVVHTIVRKNDAYINEILYHSAYEFYQCMVNFDPPSLSEKDSQMITDFEFSIYAQEWKELKKEKDKLQKREKELRQKMIDFTDDGTCQGFGISLKRKTRQGTVDWEKLWQKASEKYPLQKEFDLNTYRKPDSVFWDIREI